MAIRREPKTDTAVRGGGVWVRQEQILNRRKTKTIGIQGIARMGGAGERANQTSPSNNDELQQRCVCDRSGRAGTLQARAHAQHRNINRFFTKREATPNFSRKGMPHQIFSRKGMPSRAGASDGHAYVSYRGVALLLFKYDCCSLLGHRYIIIYLRFGRPVSTLEQAIPHIAPMG